MKIDDCYPMKSVLLKCCAKMVLFAFFFAIIAGCVGPEKKVPEETMMERWQKKAKASVGHSPGRSQPELPFSEKDLMAVLEGSKSPEPKEPKAEKPSASESERVKRPKVKPFPKDEINMKMHDVELGVLLRALARIANQNIMINDNVTGTTSINISRAQWDQVFLGVLRTHGLTYKWEGDIIRIVTVEDLRKELELQKESQDFEFKSEEFKIKTEENRNKLYSLQKKNEPMVTRVIPIKYGEVEPLKETVEKILEARQAAAQAESGEEGAAGTPSTVSGEVMLDEHSHSLVIHARESDVKVLAGLIRDLDRPTPQIRIVAHIVEATENTARHLGVQWGGLFLNASGDTFRWVGGSPPGTGQDIYDGNLNPNFIQPSTGNIVNTLPSDIAAATASGGSLALTLQEKGIGLLSVQLKALQEAGEVTILSSPSITTLDNQQATIESGKEVPFQTVEDGEVKIEFKDALLKLIVTPHVIDAKTLRLKINTNNDEVDFATAVGGQPAITTKKAETTVVLFDGQTTVIGGLSKKNLNDNVSGIPGLKDVPGLGWLFKGTSKTKTHDELLIFITLNSVLSSLHIINGGIMQNKGVVVRTHRSLTNCND